MRAAPTVILFAVALACGRRADPTGVDGQPSSPCAGLELPAATAMQQHSTPGSLDNCACLPGAGDESGMLGFPRDCPHTMEIEFVTTSGVLLAHGSAGYGRTVVQQPSGLSAVGHAYLGNLAGRGVLLTAWDSTGSATGSGYVRAGDLLTVAGDPSGGVLFAGEISGTPDPSAPLAPAATMWTGGGSAPAVRWGPQALASPGTVRGAGVDVLGRALVINDGTVSFGAGAISAQWFDADGTPLTGEFLLLSAFVAPSTTRFETSPLIGGGLAVRRVDPSFDPLTARVVAHGQWLVVVASGEPAAAPAPAWLAARPGSRLQIARGGRGYAVLPDGADGVPCTQRVEVLSAAGTSCATRDYSIADGTCDTYDLTLSADGTVIQQLPFSMETHDPLFDFGSSCTWRWWTGATP